MKKILVCLFFPLFFLGCAHKPIGTFPLEGTNTAVIRVSVDSKTGQPKVDQNIIIVRPGERVVLVGPQDFSIEFPDGSPFSKNNFATDNAVINLIVPGGASQAAISNREKVSGRKKIKYKYDVIVRGKRLDPYMIVIED